MPHISLNHALFDNAGMWGAILREAGITESMFEGARYNSRILFPAGFEPKEFGAVFEE